ncbi:MAG: hypothetical protein DSO01_04955 [Archaeoglobi archaeon]|nr:MAG: hypothetical protein DSO01_04955 [Archaeoglobi archaeon]
MLKVPEFGRKFGMLLIGMITIITMASAAPLEINIQEKVNTTASPQDYTGSGPAFSFTTNVTGFVNITNKGSDPIYDIWIALNLVNNTTSCGNLGIVEKPVYAEVMLNANPPERIAKEGVFNSSGANCIVHITILKPKDKVSLFYDVNDGAMGIENGAPFNVSETYSPSKIPAGGSYTWTVYLNTSLNETWWAKTALGSLSGNNVMLNITKYLSNQSSNYGSSNWVSLGPIANPQYVDGAQPQSVVIWDSPYVSGTNTNTALNLTGIQLNTSSKYCNVSFTVTGNYTNSSAAPHYFEPFGFAVFEFNLSYGNISGSSVVDVFAVGNASLNVTKYGPDESNYWHGNASITNTASGLTYVLTNVTMWATDRDNLNNEISDSRKNWTPSAILNPGGSWNTSQASPQGIAFYYPGVPIIWANATFKLIKDSEKGWEANNTTFNDYNATYGSNFIVIEKIYIIGTYLVKVTKHVKFNETASTGSNNVFDIYLVVENIGGNESPYVYVYDLIPENFSKFNWDYSWSSDGDGNWVKQPSMLAGNGSVSSPLSGYQEGLYWRLNPIEPGAVGDGDYTNTTAISNNQTVVIFYQLNGTGDFRVLDAFIVGIDPMYSLNEQTSPKITLVSGAKATNYETTLATVTFAGFGVLLMALRRNGRNK